MNEAELFAAKFEEQEKEHPAWFVMSAFTKKRIAKWFGFGYAAKDLLVFQPTPVAPIISTPEFHFPPKKLFVYSWEYCHCEETIEKCVIVRASSQEEADSIVSKITDAKPDALELSCVGDSTAIYDNSYWWHY